MTATTPMQKMQKDVGLGRRDPANKESYHRNIRQILVSHKHKSQASFVDSLLTANYVARRTDGDGREKDL
jgi:hypothetical protein